jgi:uncharacterized protein (TIGR00156 family)
LKWREQDAPATFNPARQLPYSQGIFAYTLTTRSSGRATSLNSGVGCASANPKACFSNLKREILMKLAKIALLVVPVLMFSSTKVAAQYLGPGAQAPSQSVAAALSAKDDSLVDISGYIIKQLTHEKYIFSDGKDQVRIEIDRDIFPNHGINEKTRVRIRGEVEKDFLESPEIDVESIDIL